MGGIIPLRRRGTAKPGGGFQPFCRTKEPEYPPRLVTSSQSTPPRVGNLGRGGGQKRSFNDVLITRTYHQKIDTVSLLRVYRRIGCAVADSWGVALFVVSSLWAFNNDNGNASNCASNCTNNCGNNVQNNADLRGGLFGSVAPLQGITLNAKTKFG